MPQVFLTIIAFLIGSSPAAEEEAVATEVVAEEAQVEIAVEADEAEAEVAVAVEEADEVESIEVVAETDVALENEQTTQDDEIAEAELETDHAQDLAAEVIAAE